jgi:hypothetical protein
VAVQDQELKRGLQLTLRNLAFGAGLFALAFGVGLLARELLNSRSAGAVAWIAIIVLGIWVFYAPGWRVLTSPERQRLVLLTVGTLAVAAAVILFVPSPWGLLAAAAVSLPALNQWLHAIRRGRPM